MTDGRTAHLTSEAIERWHRGELPADEVVATARHLEECRACATLAEPPDLDHRVSAIRVQSEELEHPDLETELFAFVAGSLSEKDHLRVDEHLRTCSRCREDVDDARSVARPGVRMTARWLIALAAVLAIGFIAALLLQSRESEEVVPPITTTRSAIRTPPPSRVDEAAMVRRAMVEAPLAMPRILRSMRSGDEVLRNAGSESAGLSPRGVVVESRRPRLLWEAPRDATSVVLIYAGDTEVAHSPPLRQTSWTPPQLERGVTYTWEVQIHTSGGLQIVPAPPAKAARFHVLEDAAFVEIDTARRQHPGDALLLGVLYARAGLEESARAELAKVRGEESTIARQRLRELDAWHR